jgi:hypothetical protein
MTTLYNRIADMSSNLIISRVFDSSPTGFAGGNDLAMSARGVATGVGGGKNILKNVIKY